jgi:hypothetical protein
MHVCVPLQRMRRMQLKWKQGDLNSRRDLGRREKVNTLQMLTSTATLRTVI